MEAHEESSLINQGEQRHARLILVHASCVRILVFEKLPGKLAPVLECRLEASHQTLEKIHAHFALAVYSQFAPGNTARHVHVGGDVEPLFDGLGQQVIQTVAHLRVALSPDVVMMVDADGVVAQTHQSVSKQVGHLMRGIIGREAQVYAIETAGPSWFLFKFKRAALGFQPSILSRRSMLQAET